MEPQKLPVLTVCVKKYSVFCQKPFPKLRIQQIIRQALRFLWKAGAMDIAQAGQIPQRFCFIREIVIKIPDMHLCFVPLTEDKRLSAKEIVGNKKKLTWWQDEFWKHMVGKYPDLERGESASETGRTHIPPRLFKEAVHLNRMKDQIMAVLNDSNPFNKKSKAEELETLLDKYVPGVEVMRTKLKKYDKTYKELTAENAELEKELNSASR